MPMEEVAHIPGLGATSVESETARSAAIGDPDLEQITGPARRGTNERAAQRLINSRLIADVMTDPAPIDDKPSEHTRRTDVADGCVGTRMTLLGSRRSGKRCR